MKVRFSYGEIQETMEAENAGVLLQKVKAEAAKRAPLLMRGAIRALPDLSFAAEAVRRENQISNRQDPPPSSAQAFLDWAIERGYVTIIE